MSARAEPNKDKIYRDAEEMDHNENIGFKRFRRGSQDDFSQNEQSRTVGEGSKEQTLIHTPTWI